MIEGQLLYRPLNANQFCHQYFSTMHEFSDKNRHNPTHMTCFSTTYDTVTFFRVSIRVEKERVSRLPMTMLERSGCGQMDMLKPCLTMGTPPRTLQRPLMTQTATRRLVSVHCTSMCIVHHFWQPSHMGNIAIIQPKISFRIVVE